MDVRNFANLKKKLAKEPNKKETGTQKPVDEFFQRDEGPSSAIPAAVGGAEAGGDGIAATKRKAVGKTVVPAGKKLKKGDAGKKAPPVLIVDEHSSSEPSVVAATTPSKPLSVEVGIPRENVQFSLVKGTAIMHGTVDPREFLKGATPELDRAFLSRLDDEALNSKILRSSLTACISLGEQVRRVEGLCLQKAQQDETLKKLVHDNAAAVREMARLEETLRQERVAAEKAKAEARAEGMAEAEKTAAEAAKKAAEAAKEGVVAKAREDAVAAEGWNAEDRKRWLVLVVEASVDEWNTGPDAEWLAWKGKDYYEGGEFFTQALV
ncbi:unnamed protein product [Cuscuta europaea]|uniref:Uncharacterized protein n=1 Tax=Cuscuta europaea TaxID=41803 RepID=A0A9P0ZRE5_CUSEU|nr:unnamed protein product [Cuscuta europaea]